MTVFDIMLISSESSPKVRTERAANDIHLGIGNLASRFPCKKIEMSGLDEN